MPDDTIDDAMKRANVHIKTLHKDGKITSCSKTGSDQGATADQEEDLEKNGCFIYKIHPPAEK